MCIDGDFCEAERKIYKRGRGGTAAKTPPVPLAGRTALRLRKAGAAGTVLRRRKKTEYLEAKSVPVGILPEIAFARSEKDLDAGDMLVMVSDGVTASGTEWLCDLIANYEDDDPQALSERIVERAVKDRADGHEDDVSAVVLLIE